MRLSWNVRHARFDTGTTAQVNVAALLERGNPVLDSMDPEVRADVEEACKIALAKIQHAAAAARRKLRAGEAPMGLETFVEAMADAIDAAPGQRTYLLPVARGEWVSGGDGGPAGMPHRCERSQSNQPRRERSAGGGPEHDFQA